MLHSLRNVMVRDLEALCAELRAYLDERLRHSRISEPDSSDDLRNPSSR